MAWLIYKTSMDILHQYRSFFFTNKLLRSSKTKMILMLLFLQFLEDEEKNVNGKSIS